MLNYREGEREREKEITEEKAKEIHIGREAERDRQLETARQTALEIIEKRKKKN